MTKCGSPHGANAYDCSPRGDELLGNCANANTYEYTQQDVDQIFSAIEAELREAKKKYQKVESNRTSKFTLK